MAPTSRFLGLTGLALAIACSPAVAGSDAEREAAARKAATSLMQELGSRLKKAMQEEGPGAAIAVCAEWAPQVTARLSREKGWRITRVSERYRNPLLGMPDAWEARGMEAFRQRHAEGESYKGMSRSEVVTGPGGKRFRYLQAIPVGGICVSCHGPEDQLAPEVRDTLAERYPHDRATGYEVGELRGAFSITQPLE